MPKVPNKTTSTTELVDAVKDAVTGVLAEGEAVGTLMPATGNEKDLSVIHDPSTAEFASGPAVSAVPGEVYGVIDTEVVQPLGTAPQPGVSPGLFGARTTIGYVIRCHRDRGIWRAGRFWTSDSIPVPAAELTVEQLEALQAEPLLSVLPVQE